MVISTVCYLSPGSPRGVIIILNYSSDAIITQWNDMEEIFPDIFLLLETVCYISLFFQSQI